MLSDSRIGGFFSKLSRILLGKDDYRKVAKDLDRMREVGELIAEVRETLRGMVEPGNHDALVK